MLAPKYPLTEYEESEVKINTYEDGYSMRVLNLDGFNYPIRSLEKRRIPDLKKTVSKIAQLECRKDDVFLFAYPKSGTHWVWEICNMLLSGSAQYNDKSKEVTMLEFRQQSDIDCLPSPRVLNSHSIVKYIPVQALEKKIKLIFVQRQVKDVAVSFYHHIRRLHGLESSFSAFQKKFRDDVAVFSNWFDYTLQWEAFVDDLPSDYPVLRVFYEDLQKDSVKVIETIAEFLGVEPNEKLYKDIAKSCSFENMKSAKIKVGNAFSGQDTSAMYRKGQTGDWKNYFTVAESEEFDRIYEEKMKNSRLRSLLL